MNLDSKIKTDFGVTGQQAIKLGLIQRGKIIGVSGKLINDGWECVSNGNNYETQYEAVKAHFEKQKALDDEAKARWESSDYQILCERSVNGGTNYKLVERKTGKIIFDKLKSKMKILDYIEENKIESYAQKIMILDR